MEELWVGHDETRTKRVVVAIDAQVGSLRKAGTEPTINVKSTKSGAVRSRSMSFCACRGSAEPAVGKLHLGLGDTSPERCVCHELLGFNISTCVVLSR